MSDLLRSKLSAVRHKRVLVSAGSGGCLGVGAVVAAIGLEMALDWEVELPAIVRCAWLAATAAMCVAIIVRDIAWPMLALPDEDEMALWVERASPGLGGRLIAAVQLERGQAVSTGHSMALVRALVRQTEEIAGPMDFLAVVKTDRLARLGAVASFVIVLGIFTLACGGSNSIALLERAFLTPGVDVPRRTRVFDLTPTPLVVAVGDSVELRARAEGVIPAAGSVQIHYDGQSQSAVFAMSSDPANAKQFMLKLDAVSRSFTYRVLLNDGHSTDGRVVASTRPAVASLSIAEVYPDYTHLGPARHPPSDLQILAGSRLAIRVKANKPIRKTVGTDAPFNRLTLQGKSSSIDIPLIVDGNDRQTLVAEDAGNPDVAIPADVTGLSIHLIDDDGLQNRNPAVYGIRLIPDLPPVLRVTYPDRKEQLSTSQARLLVGVDASDDFALGKLLLQYRVLSPEHTAPITADNANNANNGAATASMPESTDSAAAQTGSIELDLKGTPRSFRGRFDLELSQLKPPPLEHGAVEWWLAASDTNDATGPGTTVSDHYLTRIGTEAEVRSDLFARLGNHMGEIKEAAETQKQDNADLGAVIQEKAHEKGLQKANPQPSP